MLKGEPSSPEDGLGDIPTPEEVLSVLKQLIGDAEYREDQRLEDEQGLYLWDITIGKEDGSAEYSYMRKGRYPEGQAKYTVVNVTFYDTSGFPVGGHSAAKLIDGEWKLTP